MGAHRADADTSAVVGLRATATAAAVVALTGAGAGIASAHDGPAGDRDHEGCTTDGFVDSMFDDQTSATGLSRDDAEGTCADPSSLGGFDPGAPSGMASPGQASGDPSVVADRSDAGAQTRPAAHAQPASPSSIDTPPPPGQTRLIKLPPPR